MTYIGNINLANNDLGRDAWDRPKVITDKSLFHGMFTYNVPITTWYETINNTITSGTPTNCTSSNGALKVLAGASLNDDTYLRSFRSTRYQPNRGALYSTAGWIENPESNMTREWGMFTAESGVFFRLKAGGELVGVIRTTISGVTTDDEIRLNISNKIDLSKGNVYDIQYQWRGVGNYKFYINLDEVGNSNYLGTLDRLSMFNPALPVAWNSINEGDNDSMYFGCVDVTSEGGQIGGKTYASFGINSVSGSVDISGENQPIIAVRSKPTVAGLINTRDTLILAATWYGNQRCVFKVWKTRDFTAITEGNSVWEDIGDGNLEGIRMATSGGTLAFDDTKADLILNGRVNMDETSRASFQFDSETELVLTPSDMIILTMQRETGAVADVGCVLEFAEEI